MRFRESDDEDDDDYRPRRKPAKKASRYDDEDDEEEEERPRRKPAKKASRYDDDDEEEYGIDGIMIVDGAEYSVRGERSVERDGDETESETEFRVTLGERYYMSVEHSSETEDENGESSVQQEYSYSIYRDGRLVERSTVEYETENERGDSETEVKMTAYADGISSVFCFTKETVRGEEIIRLRAGEGRDVRNYIVRVIVNEDGSTDYVYEEYGGR